MLKYTYKITLSYDGTDYCGWQWQPQNISINAVMRKTFAQVFKQTDEAFLMVGASRTDAGVHAHGQVVRLKTNLGITPLKLQKVMNDSLPSSVQITHVEYVCERFHPQHNIKYKIYTYRFFTKRPSIMVQRFGWYVHKKIDFEKLQKALHLFVGTHDFVMFCTEPDLTRTTMLTIDSITLQECSQMGGYVIQVQGKSFLRHMIRRIVGAAMWVSMYPIPLDVIKNALENKKLNQTLPTAPPKGLCLEKIEYSIRDFINE